MATSTCPTCMHAGDFDHSFIRCGCPNDYPDTHPMHINDDAFHHVWCNICLKYCYKKSVCPVGLPSTHIVRPARLRLRDTYVHPFAVRSIVYSLAQRKPRAYLNLLHSQTYRILFHDQSLDPQTCLGPSQEVLKENLDALDDCGELIMEGENEEF